MDSWAMIQGLRQRQILFGEDRSVELPHKFNTLGRTSICTGIVSRRFLWGDKGPVCPVLDRARGPHGRALTHMRHSKHTQTNKVGGSPLDPALDSDCSQINGENLNFIEV